MIKFKYGKSISKVVASACNIPYNGQEILLYIHQVFVSY